MKRSISELLNDYVEKEVELTAETPLSSERIRELTMNQIREKDRKPRRTGFRVLIAAALIAALTLSVMAAEEFFNTGDWFRDILNRNLLDDRDYVQEKDLSIRETVSEGQIEVINKLGGSFQPQSYTSGGTTMTLAAAYGDAHVIRLYFQVEAPHGTVLPDGILYEFNDRQRDYDDDGHGDLITLGEDAPYKKAGQFMDIEPLPDADPMDNKKEFYVSIICQSGLGMAFNDGVTKYLHINGIYEQVVDANGDEDAYVLLAPADFAFDIGLVNEARTVELDVEGMTYGGYQVKTWTHDSPCLALCEADLTGETDPETGLPVHMEDWEYEVTVKRLSISELSADWACEWTCNREYMTFGVTFQVVMKDGTTVLTAPADSSIRENTSEGTVLFGVPIDLDEVDYILIGDPEVGTPTKVYLPQ